MNSSFNSACIYVLHLTTPDGRCARLAGRYSAGHYVGSALTLPDRLREHRTRTDGKAAVIMRETILRGLTFRLARVLLVSKTEAGRRERELKNKSIARYWCPVCRIEREQRKLAELEQQSPTPSIKQRITKARKAIRRAQELLREADDIAYIAGDKRAA